MFSNSYSGLFEKYSDDVKYIGVNIRDNISAKITMTDKKVLFNYIVNGLKNYTVDGVTRTEYAEIVVSDNIIDAIEIFARKFKPFIHIHIELNKYQIKIFRALKSQAFYKLMYDRVGSISVTYNGD